MTEAEALDMVRRTISGTVIRFSDPLYLAGQDAYLIGDENAETILRALHSAGWSWVPREPGR